MAKPIILALRTRVDEKIIYSNHPLTIRI